MYHTTRSWWGKRVLSVTVVGACASGLVAAPAARAQAPGTIVTVAGGGDAVGDGGPAIGARLFKPAGVTFDRAGDLYISDTLRSRVRRVGPDGIITTVMGTGYSDYTGDGGPGPQAAIESPFVLASDRVGGLLVADYFNEVVRRLGADGIATTMAGTGQNANEWGGFSGDGGPAATAMLNGPESVAADSLGNVYISDAVNDRIRRVGPDGRISTFAGGGNQAPKNGLSATSVHFGSVNQIAVDRRNNLYVADGVGSQVLRVTPDGTLFVAAGSGTRGFSGDGGPAAQAALNAPIAVAVDSAGMLFIADAGNQRVRRVTPDGTIETIAGSAAIAPVRAPSGFAGDGGPATDALLGYPEGLAIDGSGNLFLADTANDRVREIFAVGAPVAFPTPPTGDLNGDGQVTAADAILALKIAVGLTAPTEAQLAAGELEGGFRITISDAVAILRKAVGE